jgi:uncharacterized protein (DUF433 family)
MNYREYIVRDPSILGGVPILKGTQIPLWVVIRHLALGDSLENIVKTYPALTEDSVKAVIAFAAALAEVDLITNPELKLDHRSPAWGELASDDAITKILRAATDTRTMSASLADMYLRQGLLDAARKVYEFILEKDPGNKEALTKLDGLKNLLKPNN